MQRKLNIFAIYSWEDSDVLHQLLRHLKPIEANFNLTIWDDDPIKSGQLWQPQNESRINLTDIFLLLVSDHFMHSEFIKQLEFKLVIDRYKADKAVVLPIIIDNCQWNIEFKSDEYDFKLSELEVLPEEGKPLADWDSPDLAYKNVTDHVKRLITSLTENNNQEESNTALEVEDTNTKSKEQLAISFAEEADSKRRAEEENRRKEAAEAKRKAEEEIRVKEAAEAKRKVEEEIGLKEAAEAKRKVEEENRRKEVAKAKRKAEEENRLKEVAEAKIKAEEENRLKEAAEAKRKTEEENSIKEEVETRSKALEDDQPQLAAETNYDLEEVAPQQYPNIKKRVLVGAAVVVLAVVLIWAFSLFNSEAEIQPPTLPAGEATAVKDSTAATNTKIDSQKKAATLSKLGIGDLYEGGFIFTIDMAGKTGKIAHTDDAGPMTWNNAINIHEQLGEGWRLPSFEELAIMYRNIGQGAANTGEFANSLYWSATAYDDYQARLLRFSDGNTSYHYNKELENRKFRVRAIRDFSR